MNPHGAVDFHAHPVDDVFRREMGFLGLDPMTEDGFPLPDWSVSAHLQFMEEAEIDFTVLSVPTPHIHIITVLSGMSSVAQMEDNLSYMKNFQPLNEEEQKIIRQAQKILGSSAEIPCTACHYCTDGCPKQIPIPDIFAAANLQLGNGQTAQAKERYEGIPQGHRATDCVECRQCERACPQHLKIVDYLKQCGKMLGE